MLLSFWTLSSLRELKETTSIFMHLSRKIVSVVTCAAKPENCPQILDEMVLLQKLPKILKTFGDIRLSINEIT